MILDFLQNSMKEYIILTQHTNTLKAFLLQQKIEIESITQEYLKETKVLTVDTLEQYRKKMLSVI